MGLPVLLFVYYVGHGVTKRGLVHCVDETGDSGYNLEGFVQACALMPNIYTVCVLDCCRREEPQQDGNNDVLVPKNESLLDVITVYRSAVTALACTCNPWRDSEQNLAEQLFGHFAQQRESRAARKSAVKLPDDLISF